MNVEVGDGSVFEGRTIVGVSALIEDLSIFLEDFLFLKPGFAIRTRSRDDRGWRLSSWFKRKCEGGYS